MVPVGQPSAYIEHDLAQGKPHGHLDDPSVADRPRQREDLGPLRVSVPIALSHAPPRVMTAGILANVSTLFIKVGQPQSPDAAGYGGRGLGVPRPPCTEAIKAVSSPHTNAPAPMRTSTWKPTRVPLMPAPGNPATRPDGWRLSDALPAGVLRPDVHVAPRSAHCVARYGHSFEHLLRAALEDAPVHERTGVALVRVADDELALGPAALATVCHLSPVG